MVDFIYFGIIDNFIMLLCAVYGFSLENKFKIFKAGTGALYGAGIGNALSDFAGGIAASDLTLAIGTATGCLICLILVPVMLKLNKGAN